MNMVQFVEMLRAIDEDREFLVGFQLQHSSDGNLTLQELCQAVDGYDKLSEFFERVAAAEPPVYKESR